MSDEKSQGVLILVAVLLLAGLGGWLAYLLAHPVAPFPLVPKNEQSLVSPALDIDVYVDGSKSIWHFLHDNSRTGSTGVSSGKANYLFQFLNHVETTLNPKIRGWKFGGYGGEHGKGSAVPLEGGPDRLTNAPETEFNAARTPIEVAVTDEPKRANPAELRIVVTDLYQSDLWVAQYEKPLADKYLADGTHAVEIFAIRNPFDGEVQDLPGLDKGTLHGAADTMPFYVIVAGLTPDVLRVREALINDAADGIFEALHRHQAIEMLFAKDAGVAKPAGPMIEVPGRGAGGGKPSVVPWELKANDGKASYVVVGERAGFTQVTVRQSGKFRVSWPLPPIDASAGHVDTIGRSNLSLNVQVFASVKSQEKPGGPDKGMKDQFRAQEIPDAAAAVTLSCGEERPFPCAVLDKSRLAKGRYLFRFDVEAKRPAPGSAESVFEPGSPLMGDWNIEKDEARRISTGAKKFPALGDLASSSSRPGRTPQLAQFLHALQEKVFDSPVRMVSYYLYVEAK